MVINNDPNYEKKKRAEERLNRPEDEQKEEIISKMREESVSILCLALMYAKNFEETGEDLTRCLINVEKNADILQQVYNKGYAEGYRKGVEHEHIQRLSKIQRRS